MGSVDWQNRSSCVEVPVTYVWCKAIRLAAKWWAGRHTPGPDPRVDVGDERRQHGR